MSNTLLDFLLRPQVDSLQLLVFLAEGLDPNYMNPSGMTPLKAAVMNCDWKIVDALILHGAKVDSELAEFANSRYPHKPKVCEVITAKLMTDIIDELNHESKSMPANAPVSRRRTPHL